MTRVIALPIEVRSLVVRAFEFALTTWTLFSCTGALYRMVLAKGCGVCGLFRMTSCGLERMPVNKE